jgi:hypothetical protein
MENFRNAMKNKIILSIIGVISVAACGPGPQSSTPDKSPATAPQAGETLPEHDSTGVISAVNGLTLTLDHDGASAAGLAAGRNDFTGYADVLSDAPLTPGVRVAFKFRKNGEGLELVELKGR